ncbi:MAG: rod shape-determining protein, partial [Sphingomonadales bacterium]|nr:rod shape-determining protein [Sphingomonadales bacterium]
PANMYISKPLQRGVLQDMASARESLSYALARAVPRKSMTGPRGVFGIPADATEAERGALLTAARDAGFKSARLVAEPYLAALGAGLPVDKPTGTMIVECGAGTTEVAVISLGNICVTRSVRSGGASLDKAISDHLHFRHKFLVGEASAENLKIAYVLKRTSSPDEPGSLSVKGRCLTSGMPSTLEVPVTELDEVVEKHVRPIVDVIRDALLETPPELSRDIHDRGIVLTGGSSVMPLLRTMIEESTGLAVSVAQEPEHGVARGLQRLLA